MPWTAEDAGRHTKKAVNAFGPRSPIRCTGDDGRAIREANAAVAKDFANPIRPLLNRSKERE
jgi:hypothetical protein